MKIASRLPALALLAAAVTGSAAEAARLNILWLIAEDTGPSAYSCYGGQPAARTPAIDRLAAEGVRYTRFYTTAPVCSPSRSAFNTGMYQTTIGAHQHRTPEKRPLPEGVRTLPEWFRAVGYHTANVREFPSAMNLRGAGKTDWNFISNEQPLYDGDRWEDLARRQPFYAQINFQETHRDFGGEGATDPAQVVLPPYYPDHPAIRKDYADYLDSARRLDGKIARILARLEEEGLAANTLVLFMGDNGEAHIRGKQFCYEEGLRVPFIVRWPTGRPAPAGYRAGSVEARLLEAIDVAPTLLSLAGAALPTKMQGVAFLGDKEGPPKSHVFGARDRCDETAMRIRTVRDSRYRYILTFTPEIPLLAPNAYKARQYPAWTLVPRLHAEGRLDQVQANLCAPRQPEEQLFDLETDPHEIRNLSDSSDPVHATALRRLRAELAAWIERTDDQGRFPEKMSPAEADAAVRRQQGAAKQKSKGK